MPAIITFDTGWNTLVDVSPMISSSRWCGIRAYSIARFILTASWLWYHRLKLSHNLNKFILVCLPNWCAHMAVARLSSKSLGPRRAAMITCGSSYVNNNFVSRRGLLQGTLTLVWTGCKTATLWRQASQKPMKGFTKSRSRVYRTYSQDKRDRHIFRVISTLAKELRKIRDRTVRVH